MSTWLTIILVAISFPIWFTVLFYLLAYTVHFAVALILWALYVLAYIYVAITTCIKWTYKRIIKSL